MHLRMDEDLGVAEAREKAELAVALGIPAERLTVSILPQISSYSERQAARAVRRGELFFPSKQV